MDIGANPESLQKYVHQSILLFCEVFLSVVVLAGAKSETLLDAKRIYEN
ncbi:hypothetical protein HGG72_22510 [Ochrobactrum pecoris]|nr:hypothetical protein [Brucella pecoris]